MSNKILHIEGMDCNSCAIGIEKFLKKQRGISDVNVSFPNKEASYNTSEETSVDTIIAGINKMGYQAYQDEKTSDDLSKLKKQITWLNTSLIICLICTIPLNLSMLFHSSFLMNPYVQLVLCLPVFIIGFMQFGRNAYMSLKAGFAHMDVLIFMGMSLSFLYSVYGIFVKNDTKYLFFETTATIVTLVLLGNWFEKRAVKQTTDALDGLYAKQDQIAKLYMSDGTLQDIKMKDVRIDQVLLSNQGDMIACDGIITEGEAYIDEAMMTGEPLPLHKSIGATVNAGTIVHKGSIKIQATKDASQTYLSELIRLTQVTLREKAPIQKMADKLTSWFVPVVLTIMVLTFIINYFVVHIAVEDSILRAVAVAVISCPCAMGLATPTAIMVGLSRAFKNGILIKGAETFEKFDHIKNVVFDKTGTLTQGDFEIEKIITHQNTDQQDLINILVAIEKKSSHPIAIAIVKKLQATVNIQLTSVEEQMGVGLVASYQDATYEVGSAKILSLEDYAHVSNAQIFITRNKLLIGEVYLKDQVKPYAKELIDFLKKDGKKNYLLSGDRKENVERIAQELDILQYKYEVKPADKYNFISSVQKEGGTAMIGDGINDSLSITKADIGISFSNSSDIAMQSANVIINHDDLRKVELAFRLSQKTVATIKQNLFWAIAYNIVAIPLAAMGFLTPIVAATCMIFSDIIVIGNSIFLKYKKI